MRYFYIITIIFNFFSINFLVAEEIMLDEISISANRFETKLSDVGSSVRIITKEDLSNSEDSYLIDYLQKIPGVSVNQSGPKGSTSGLFLRGLDLKYIKVLVDGIDIGDVSSIPVTANMSSIMAHDIDRLEVLQGSQSALYGGSAVGGVISIATKKNLDSLGSFSSEIGSYGTISFNFDRSLLGEKSDTFLKGSFFSTDGFSAKSGGSETDGYENSKFSILSDYYISDTATAKIVLFLQNENGDQDGYQVDPPYGFIDKDDEIFSEEKVGFKTGLEMNYGDLYREVNVQYFNVDRFYTGPYEYEGTRADFSFLEKRNLASNAFIYGFGSEMHQTSLEGTEKSINLAHLFGELIVNGDENMILTFSGRSSGHSVFGGSSTGRISASYKFSAGQKVRGSVGTGYRPPSLYELFAPFLGNDGLQPETSVTADIGVEIPVYKENSLLSAAIFHTTISDRIVYDFETNGYGQSLNNEERFGYELSSTFQLNEEAKVALSLTHTEDGNGGKVQRVPLDELVLTASNKFDNGLQISGTARRVSGLEDFEPLPDYTLVDMKMSYPLTEKVDIYLRGENLFDTEYQTVADYGTPGRSVYTGFKAKF